MKLFKLLSFLIISVVLANCAEAINDEVKFNAKSLEQTTWEGTEVVTNGDQTVRLMNVEMQFITSTSGKYVIREKGAEAEVYDFKYSIEGKIINIKDGPLFGNRTLIEISKNKMILEGFNSYRTTLTLVRKY